MNDSDFPKTSYGATITLFLDLMGSFVRKTEDQISEGVLEYKTSIINQDKFREENKNNPDYWGLPISNTHYHYNVGDEFDLDFMFIEYFPSFQRKSALISLLSFLEFELKQLCGSFKETAPSYKEFIDTKKKESLSKIRMSFSFLKEVVKLNLQENTFKQIELVQKIRNTIVHQNGHIETKDNDHKKITEFFLENTQFGRVKNEITLKDGFLQYVLNLFDAFFEEIDNELYNKGLQDNSRKIPCMDGSFIA